MTHQEAITREIGTLVQAAHDQLEEDDKKVPTSEEGRDSGTTEG
jgi:hypothetical protein